MTEKLTMKKLAAELDVLRGQIQELEQQLERRLESTLEKAAAALKSRIESRSQTEHGTSIDAERRQQMIAEEAYLIAERRGFEGGDPGQDWRDAEIAVNNRLMQEAAPVASKPGTRRKKTTGKKPATKRAAAKSSAT
jgi:transcriptional regulator with XRE-family HTH domain